MMASRTVFWIATIALFACGASQAPIEAPEPVEVEPRSAPERTSRQALEVGIEALVGEQAHGVLRVDHVQLSSGTMVRRLFDLGGQPDAMSLDALSGRIARSQLAWRHVDGSAVWLPSAFEVTHADGIEPLVASVLPGAEPLTSLEGFANEHGAIVRVGERTFLTGDLQTIRGILDVGAPLEVNWPTHRPAVEGRLGFGTPDEPRPLAINAAVLTGAELVAELDDENLQLRIEMASPDPETLASQTRVLIDQFRQSLTGRRNAILTIMRSTIDTLFEDAQIDIVDTDVRLLTTLTRAQAELMLSYIVFTIDRTQG